VEDGFKGESGILLGTPLLALYVISRHSHR
jgi:hypothetical protein